MLYSFLFPLTNKLSTNKLSRAIFTGSNKTLRISNEFANVKYRIVMSCYVILHCNVPIKSLSLIFNAHNNKFKLKV